MGVRTTVNLCPQKRSSTTSKGHVQERLLHQSLCNNYKIKHEHHLDFSTHHHKKTNSRKKA
jgi:hypothetical protein